MGSIIMTGGLMASTGYALAPYIDSKEIPMTYPIMAPDDLTQRQRAKWIVRTGWNSSQPNHPLGEYAYQILKYRKVAVMGLDYAFGWESAGGFQKTFEEAGGKMIQKIWMSADGNRFQSLSFTDFRRMPMGFMLCSCGPLDAPVHQAIPGIRPQGQDPCDRRRDNHG